MAADLGNIYPGDRNDRKVRAKRNTNGDFLDHSEVSDVAFNQQIKSGTSSNRVRKRKDGEEERKRKKSPKTPILSTKDKEELQLEEFFINKYGNLKSAKKQIHQTLPIGHSYDVEFNDAIKRSVKECTKLLLDWSLPQSRHIGKLCKIYWDGQCEWYNARVLMYDANFDKYYIHYESDNTTEWISFSDEAVMVVDKLVMVKYGRSNASLHYPAMHYNLSEKAKLWTPKFHHYKKDAHYIEYFPEEANEKLTYGFVDEDSIKPMEPPYLLPEEKQRGRMKKCMANATLEHEKNGEIVDKIMQQVRKTAMNSVKGEDLIGVRVRASSHRLFDKDDTIEGIKYSGGYGKCVGTIAHYCPANELHFVVFDEESVQPQWISCRNSDVEIILPTNADTHITTSKTMSLALRSNISRGVTEVTIEPNNSCMVCGRDDCDAIGPKNNDHNKLYKCVDCHHQYHRFCFPAECAPICVTSHHSKNHLWNKCWKCVKCFGCGSDIWEKTLLLYNMKKLDSRSNADKLVYVCAECLDRYKNLKEFCPICFVLYPADDGGAEMEPDIEYDNSREQIKLPTSIENGDDNNSGPVDTSGMVVDDAVTQELLPIREDSMVQCNECSRWVHAYCEGIDQAQYEAMTLGTHPVWGDEYLCPICRINISIQVIEQLKVLDSLYIFAQPVTEKEAKNYFDVIHNPMDLSTMDRKARKGIYKSLQALRQDFELMCLNAIVFNKDGDEYWREARAYHMKCRNIFDSLARRTHVTAYGVELAEMVKDYVDPFKAANQNQSTANPYDVVTKPTATRTRGKLSDDVDVDVTDNMSDENENDDDAEETEANKMNSDSTDDNELQMILPVTLARPSEPNSYINCSSAILTAEEAFYSCYLDQCLFCGSSGSSEMFIYCTDCGEAFHSFCADAPIALMTNRLQWRCVNCKICETCLDSTGNYEDEQLLYCELCDKSYHLSCVIPKVDSVPSTSWICHNCVACNRCKDTRMSKSWGSEVSLCRACILDDENSVQNMLLNSRMKEEYELQLMIEEDILSRSLRCLCCVCSMDCSACYINCVKCMSKTHPNCVADMIDTRVSYSVDSYLCDRCLCGLPTHIGRLDLDQHKLKQCKKYQILRKVAQIQQHRYLQVTSYADEDIKKCEAVESFVGSNKYYIVALITWAINRVLSIALGFNDTVLLHILDQHRATLQSFTCKRFMRDYQLWHKKRAIRFVAMCKSILSSKTNNIEGLLHLANCISSDGVTALPNISIQRIAEMATSYLMFTQAEFGSNLKVDEALIFTAELMTEYLLDKAHSGEDTHPNRLQNPKSKGNSKRQKLFNGLMTGNTFNSSFVNNREKVYRKYAEMKSEAQMGLATNLANGYLQLVGDANVRVDTHDADCKAFQSCVNYARMELSEVQSCISALATKKNIESGKNGDNSDNMPLADSTTEPGLPMYRLSNGVELYNSKEKSVYEEFRNKLALHTRGRYIHDGKSLTWKPDYLTSPVFGDVLDINKLFFVDCRCDFTKKLLAFHTKLLKPPNFMMLKYDVDKEYTTTFSAVGLKRTEAYGLLHNVSQAVERSSTEVDVIVPNFDRLVVPKAPEVVASKKKYVKKTVVPARFDRNLVLIQTNSPFYYYGVKAKNQVLATVLMNLHKEYEKLVRKYYSTTGEVVNYMFKRNFEVASIIKAELEQEELAEIERDKLKENADALASMERSEQFKRKYQQQVDNDSGINAHEKADNSIAGLGNTEVESTDNVDTKGYDDVVASLSDNHDASTSPLKRPRMEELQCSNDESANIQIEQVTTTDIKPEIVSQNSTTSANTIESDLSATITESNSLFNLISTACTSPHVCEITKKCLLVQPSRGWSDGFISNSSDIDKYDPNSLDKYNVNWKDFRFCVLCKESVEDEVVGRLGLFSNGQYVHVNCARFSEEVYERDNILVGSMASVNRGSQYRCNFCHVRGASIPCHKRGCRVTYHLKCALLSRCLFFETKAIIHPEDGANEDKPYDIHTCMYCPQHYDHAIALVTKSIPIIRAKNVGMISDDYSHVPEDDEHYQLPNETIVKTLMDYLWVPRTPMRPLLLDETEDAATTVHDFCEGNGKSDKAYRCGGLTVFKLGKPSIDLPNCHTETHIFPHKFKSSRIFWSMNRPYTRIVYLFEILLEHEVEIDSFTSDTPSPIVEGCKDTPVFRVISSDTPCNVIVTRCIEEAYKTIIDGVYRINGHGFNRRRSHVGVYGLNAYQFFGLTVPFIREAIELLPESVSAMVALPPAPQYKPTFKLPVEDDVARIQQQQLLSKLPNRSSINGCARADTVEIQISMNRGRRVTRILAKSVDDTTKPYPENTTDENQIVNIDESLENKREQEYNKLRYIELSKSYLRNPFERLDVKKSHIHGWGLFARCSFAKDDMIVEYIGVIIRQAVADRREAMYEDEGVGSCYLFRLDKDDIIDATRTGGMARFMNHCCEPNAYARNITTEGLEIEKHIVIFAARDIQEGEEITYDYKFPIEETKLKCYCGATKCKGSLN